MNDFRGVNWNTIGFLKLNDFWRLLNLVNVNFPMCHDAFQCLWGSAELTNTLMLFCLYSHLLPDRLSKGEEVWLFNCTFISWWLALTPGHFKLFFSLLQIFFFCFNFLKHIVSEKFSAVRKQRCAPSFLLSGWVCTSLALTGFACLFSGGKTLSSETVNSPWRISVSSVSLWSTCPPQLHLCLSSVWKYIFIAFWMWGVH